MSALLSTRVPKYEDEQGGKGGDESGKLKIDNIVTSATFAKIDSKIILDPTGE